MQLRTVSNPFLDESMAKKRSEGDLGSHFDHKSKIFFRQSYGSRIYLRQTYASNYIPTRHFLLLVTGEKRQIYASKRGNIMG